MSDERLRAFAIDHVVLRVRNIDTSIEFYSRHLGAEQESHLDEKGFVSMRIGDALIDLAPSDEPDSLGSRGVAHICLVVEGVTPESARSQLESAGVLVEHHVNRDRLGARGEGPSLYITDPDGYRIELKWYE